MDEFSHDLHMRRTTTHNHLVLQKPRYELIKRITRPPDGPAASQIPVIPWHDEYNLVTVNYRIERNPLRRIVFLLEGLLPTLHALIHKRGTSVRSNVRPFSKRLSIHSWSMLARYCSRISVLFYQLDQMMINCYDSWPSTLRGYSKYKASHSMMRQCSPSSN